MFTSTVCNSRSQLIPFLLANCYEMFFFYFVVDDVSIVPILIVDDDDGDICLSVCLSLRLMPIAVF